MIDCLELSADIVDVYVAASGPIQYSQPYNVPQASIKKSEIIYGGRPFAASLLYAFPCFSTYINDERVKAHSVNPCLEVEPGISLKSPIKDGIAGHISQIQIAMKSYERAENVSTMLNLINTMRSFDVFLVDADDNIYLVRGEYPAAKIGATINLPASNQHDITIEISSVTGLQRII